MERDNKKVCDEIIRRSGVNPRKCARVFRTALEADRKLFAGGGQMRHQYDPDARLYPRA